MPKRLIKVKKTVRSVSILHQMQRQLQEKESLFNRILPLQIHLNAQVRQDMEKIWQSLQESKNLLHTFTQNLSKRKDEATLSHVRHDLRSFVGAAIGYAELILENESDVGPDLKDSLRLLIRKAQKFLSLLPDLRSENLWEIRAPKKTNRHPSALAEKNVLLPPPPLPADRGVILIVDDTPAKRDLLARHLAPQQHTILQAEDGYRALKMLEKHSIDLILLDIRMPKLSGYEVLKRLKKEEKTQNIPVLVISSVSDLKSVVQCIEGGAEDYLPLPINTTLLYARVNAGLSKKRMLDQEKEHIQRLNEARHRLETAIDNIDEGFALFDSRDFLIMCNEKYRKLYPAVQNLPADGRFYCQILKESCQIGTYFIERRRTEHPEKTININVGRASFGWGAWIKKRLRAHKNPSEAFLEHLCDGRFIEVIENKLPDGGTVAVYKDITERRKQETEMQYVANHDSLTGLGNRKLFEQSLQQACDLIRTSPSFSRPGISFALFFIDLDRFKAVNDEWGHEVGDELLIFVSTCLRKNLRQNDVIARLGGDEFCILLKNVRTQDEAEQMAQRLLKEMEPVFLYRESSISFGMSIGIALCPQDAQEPEDLLSKADHAMYQAKKTRTRSYKFAHDLSKPV